MSTGKLRWQVPLGSIRDIAPIPLPIELGVPNLGGPLVNRTLGLPLMFWWEGPDGSRLLSGHSALADEVEGALARWLHADAALLLGSERSNGGKE